MIEYYVMDNMRFAFISGSQCSNMEIFYRKLKKQIDIPDYFGDNLDALDEILFDLSWIKEKKLILIISEFDIFLQEDMESKALLVELLENAMSEKFSFVSLKN